MSLRSKLARVLDGFGVVQAALSVRHLMSPPWLTTLCYHRTAEPAAKDDLDAEIIDATPAQFDQQMKFLSEHFSFVSVDEVVDFVQGKGRLPKNPVLVTFDDGYKECFTLSLPILLRYGATGTFFIPTQQMTERKMFWWDKFAWILRNTKLTRLVLPHPRTLVLSLASDEERKRAHLLLTNLVKQTRGLDLERFMDQLEKIAEVSLPAVEERRLVDRVMMTWDEVQALSRAGMSIGSHSHTHRVLQTLEPEEYERELVGSRRELQQRIDAPITTIAYPVGYPLRGDMALRRAVLDAGYVLGFTTRAGVMSGTQPDPLDVPRILMDISYDLQHFSAIATLPPLAPPSNTGLSRPGN